LNTRRIALPVPEGLREVERSVYNYGLPDFSQLNLHPGRSEGDQNRLAELIAAVIRTFEPRILDVKVTVSRRPDAMQNVRFQVSGRLKMKPRPEPIFYDTTLDVTRGDYAVQISGEARAS
jgi:type VI secretion system protein ImpF